MTIKRDRSRNTRYDDRLEKKHKQSSPHYFGQSNHPIWEEEQESAIKPPTGRQPMMPWEIGFRGYYDK